MTQEDKELLLKDLCARLPYGVKVKLGDNPNIFDLEYRIKFAVMYGNYDKLEDILDITNIKPYLFPLSSMTEEQVVELKEYTELLYEHNTLELVEWTETHTTLEFWLEEVPANVVIKVFDWLNKNHFDYRGLIEKELANDATGKNIY